MSDIAIRAENVSKYYKLGQINNGTLFADIQTWFAMKLHREDPHSKIGENRYAEGKEGFWALKDLNFEIKQGDRVGIIGKNGAGKSTLLKVLSEITAPTSGEINIKGRIASLLEVGTGFHPEMTGRENIYMNGAILGMKRADITRKLDEIIAFSEIEQHIDTPVKRYSSGMYVRLAFAVAAHLDSEILIADEVLAVGDAAFQKKALGKMNDLSTGQGRTVLFVSHNMAQVKNLCETGIVLDKGKIKCIDVLTKSIDAYLDVQPHSKIEVTKEFLTNSDYLSIKKISIVDSKKQPLEKITNIDEIFFQITFDIESITNDFTIGYTLYNSENLPVFRTLHSDITEKQPILQKGNNTIIARVPTNILREGWYTIKVDASLFNKKWLINPNETSVYQLSFLVQDVIFNSNYSTNAIIAPQIIWSQNENI